MSPHDMTSVDRVWHLPQHYATLGEATYPCVLKGAQGQYGKNVHVVHSAEEALRLTGT